MPLAFLCPSCRTKLGVAEEHQGKQVRCPGCAAVLSVPKMTAPPPPSPPAPSPVRRTPPANLPKVVAANPPAVPPPPSPPVRRAPPSNPPKVVAAKKPATPAGDDPYQVQKDMPARRAPSPPPRRAQRDEKPIKKKSPSWLVAGVAAGCGIFVLCAGLGGGLIAWVAKSGPDEVSKTTVENKASAAEKQVELQADPAAVLNPAPAEAAAPTPQPPPIEPVANVPDGPLPSQLDPAALRKIKQATVYLKVDLPNGSAAEGSGFLCLAPRIVVTNAHVLGMLRGDSLPPTRVEVVLHSGEPNEKKTTGAVLGVDRTNDLAVLRLPDDFEPLPSPLPVDSATKLIETQKVYIFGFPFGARLGKNITVSESSVSSLRRDESGALSQVQVNGGMNPGNSGGPVTDTRGVVIGVSVAIIRGTQINFAIPGDLVRQVLDGRFGAAEFGTAYQSGGQVKLPVKLTCLDPLRRIRQIKLDVGTGAPGTGQRTSLAAVFRDGAYRTEVPLPSSGSGQACWIQPVLIKASGQSERGKAIPVPADAQIVLQRKPALLQFKPPSAAIERTLQLDSDVAVSVYEGKDDAVFHEKMKGKVLESLNPDPRGIGTFIRLTLADCPFTRETGDKTLEAPLPARNTLKRFSPTFLVDASNACKERGKRNFTVVAADYREAVESMFETVCNTYESTILPLPNRMAQPQESWQARMPMFVLSRGKRSIQDIFVTCTYEGVHAGDNGEEAHITLSGVVKGRGNRGAAPLGQARGQARFDVEKGFFSLVHLIVSSEVENEESGVRVLVNDHSIVRRGEGNQLGIAAATSNQPGLPAQRPPNAGPLGPRMPRQPGQPIRRPPPIGR
ncbi:MAG: S1C family serine protease [Gemmataceae bacterium]